MAEPRLIDAYLTELAYSVRALPDADDIVDEAADHLACAIDAGLSETEALARFGSAPLVSRVFAEEAKRGGAVSTTLTKRAGIAAMATVPMLVVGSLGNELTGRGALHGVFVTIQSLSVVAFALGVWGLRRRHGGLGVRGRVALALFAIAPFMLVFSWVAIAIWAIELMLVLLLIGSAMLAAAILPPAPLWLITLTPAVALVGLVVLMSTGGDADPLLLAMVVPTGVGFTWLGRAMSKEPALDSVSERRGVGAMPT